jgi:hypothetical protein
MCTMQLPPAEIADEQRTRQQNLSTSTRSLGRLRTNS